MLNIVPDSPKKVAIITNNVGCERHVQYYSTLEKYMVENNWTVADHFDVDKVIIAGCGFHDFMMDKVSRTLKHLLKEKGIKEENIIISACLPHTHSERLKKEFHGSLVHLDDEQILDEITSADVPFNQVVPPNIFKRPESWNIPKDENFYIKIGRGCPYNCTYCIITKAKGYIESVPVEEIKEQFTSAVKSGYKNIYLMGEDTFAYGIDQGTTIVELVDTLLKISPDVTFAFGNWYSRWLLKYEEDILRFCKMGVIKRLSIGLQHVNEELLKRMARRIDFQKFYSVLKRFRKECPDLYLTADIMVGFPGETKEMFEELVRFFEQDTVFNTITHFGYSDVEGAASASFDGKVDSLQIGVRWDKLKNTLGERSFYNSVEAPDANRTAFRESFLRDFTFCKDTF